MGWALTKQLAPLTMRSRVVELIKQAMVAGELQPGDRIVELKLARQLGVGTTSVREALFDLQDQGFVTRVPNRGTYVTKLSFEDIRQIYQVRMELEGLAVDLLTKRLQPEHEETLQQWLDKMRKEILEEGNLIQLYQADLEFHRTIWHLSGNRYISELLERIVAPLFAFYLLRTRSGGPEDIKAHQKVLDAMRAKAPSEARKAMSRMLEESLHMKK